MSYRKIELNLLFTLASSSLDESDFILLAVKLLEKKIGKTPCFPVFFEQIKRQYLDQDYKGAITNILSLCKKNETIVVEHVAKVLDKAATQLTNNPKENVSRRFYETLYARHLERIIRENNDFSMFDELNTVYDAVKPEYAVNDLVQISNFEDARTLLLSFLILNDNVELELKEGSAIYRTKDRSRAELGKILSTNPGIMKPNSANFTDNRVPSQSIPKINIDEGKREGYSKRNPQTPFVASLSGTTFSLVFVLQHYIEKHQADNNLEAKVNRIIELWVAAYITDGYHSYGEVIDIFKDPYIQSIFSKANIKLNYALVNDTSDVFRQAQDYAFGIATRAIMHPQLAEEASRNFKSVLTNPHRDIDFPGRGSSKPKRDNNSKKSDNNEEDSKDEGSFCRVS